MDAVRKIAPPRWEEGKHGAHNLEIFPGLKLRVEYEAMRYLEANEPSWNIYVFGLRLRTRAVSASAAKDKAERAARSWCAQMIDALEKVDV